MTSGRRLGILGGTFDPVHYGHLDAADAARAALALDTVRFMPSSDPPHRSPDPRVSTFHRFAMCALAVADRPGYAVSDEELGRAGRSYTADTLRALHRQGWDAAQIFFIIGSDAFAEIASWREYPAVVEASNFIVIGRTGTTLDRAVARVPELQRRVRACPDGPPAGGETAIFLVEAQTRDVSSTALRARVANQQPIDELVPPTVAHHIATHHLYAAVDNLHG